MLALPGGREGPALVGSGGLAARLAGTPVALGVPSSALKSLRFLGISQSCPALPNNSACQVVVPSFFRNRTAPKPGLTGARLLHICFSRSC